MTKTWTKITGDLMTDAEKIQLRRISFSEREPLTKKMIDEKDCFKKASLSLVLLSDLNLGHASTTDEMFAGLKEKNFVDTPKITALKAVTQLPSIFRKRLLYKPPTEHCLVATLIRGVSGRVYVPEIGIINNELYLNFRPADADVRWPDYEPWLVATQVKR